jgi:hypothetical protein
MNEALGPGIENMLAFIRKTDQCNNFSSRNHSLCKKLITFAVDVFNKFNKKKYIYIIYGVIFLL